MAGQKTEAGSEPVFLGVTLRGLQVTSPQRRMAGGQIAAPAYLAVAVRRIAPTVTTEQVTAVISKAESDPASDFTGSITRGRVIPNEGELFTPLTLSPWSAELIIAALEAMSVVVDLTPEQRRLLRIGAVADTWAADAVKKLQADFPWYTLEIWHSQLDMHTRLVAEAVGFEEREPGNTAAGRGGLIAKLRAPLEVLEATRRDTTVVVRPAAVKGMEARHWAAAAGMWTLLWQQTPPRSEPAIFAIAHYWTAPSVYDPAVKDHAARMEFLRRAADTMGRNIPGLRMDGDYTQELIGDPGRYTDKPFHAHLDALPITQGDLHVVPAHAEHRYRFSVDFPSLFDAFGNIAYRWDVLEWKTEDTDAARKKAVSDIESGHSDADRRTTGRHEVRNRDVLYSRVGKDLSHARADVQRIVGTIGPATVEIAPELLTVFALRTVATSVRTLVDLVTLEHGAGVRERMITVPGPGLWVIRALAVPLFTEKSEVHRAPSVAYIPVYAMPQEQLAEQALADAVKARADEEKSRLDARQALLDLAGGDENEATRAMAKRLADDPRLGTDRWAALAASLDEMKATLKVVELSLADSTTSPADRPLLEAQRTVLERQIKNMEQTLATHAGRTSDVPELKHGQVLTAQLVTDDGHTIPLSLEWAEIPSWEADIEALLRAPANATYVVLSDHTHPKAGWSQGSGSDRDRALLDAVASLLESRNGYGRGLVAVKLPSGSTKTCRIEASVGQIANETLDDLTTLVTLAALAAAPFTAGASLTILVPVGIVGGLRAAERMYARYDASTLRWDLDTLQDFVDIATAAVGAGAALKGAKSGMQLTRIGRLAAVSFDVASNTTGYVILGIRLEDQLREINETPGISAGERSSLRAMAIGAALQGAGMMTAGVLIPKVYGPHAQTPHPETPGHVPPVPDQPPVVPHEPPPAEHLPPTELTPPAVKPETPPVTGGEETPDSKRPVSPGVEKPPAEHLPPTELTPPAVKPKTPPVTGGEETPDSKHPVSPGVEKPPATPPPDKAVVAPESPKVIPEPPVETPDPQQGKAVPPVPVQPAVKPPPAAPKPTSIDDLIESNGMFKPEYPELVVAWDKDAEDSRTGGTDPFPPREWAVRAPGRFAKLLDTLLPSGWREGQQATYPGARPDAVALPIEAPQPGTPVEGTTGKTWKRRVVKNSEITLRMDGAGEQYWLFPDLVEGEVLVLPNGSRIWLDPVTGEIVDRSPVGEGLGRLRGRTRGEEVLFTASDRSPAHEAAGSERAHGATQPGMGGDAGYSVAYGPKRLNQGFERSGIEMWVRRLAKNAEPGVTYVYTTRTRRSARGDLLSRHYEVAAHENGKSTVLATFQIEMEGGGITDKDVKFTAYSIDGPAMEQYGAPTMKEQPKSKTPAGDVSVHIPPELAEWVLGGEQAKNAKVTSPLTPELEAAAAARVRLGALAERALVASEQRLQRPMAELDQALLDATDRVRDGSLDPEGRKVLADIVGEINKLANIRTRFDRIEVARIWALTRMLMELAANR